MPFGRGKVFSKETKGFSRVSAFNKRGTMSSLKFKGAIRKINKPDFHFQTEAE